MPWRNWAPAQAMYHYYLLCYNLTATRDRGPLISSPWGLLSKTGAWQEPKGYHSLLQPLLSLLPHASHMVIYRK